METLSVGQVFVVCGAVLVVWICLLLLGYWILKKYMIRLMQVLGCEVTSLRVDVEKLKGMP